MLPFKKILYPTDFSEPSYEALKAANELVLHFSAELCVIHVISPAAQAPADPAGSAWLILQEKEKAAGSSLEEVVTKRIPEAVPVHKFVVLGVRSLPASGWA